MRQAGFPFQSSSVWGKLIFATRGELPEGVSELRNPDDTGEKPTPLRFRYELPRSGEVSIGLYDQDNILRRQILAEAKREAGTVTERWDGLNDEGDPLPAGAYYWRGVVSDPIETEFILSVHNSGTPPHKTDDGTGGWGGDHGDPTTVAAVGERMLLAWSVAESGWGVIRTDLAGDKQWGTKAAATYLAVDDNAERYFAAGGHGFAQHAGVRVYAVADARPLNFGSGEPLTEAPVGADAENVFVTGIAASNGKLYVSYEALNLVAVNDADSGKLLNAWQVQTPGRLAIHRDGSLLAISGERIMKITGGNATVFADAHLHDPKGITVDAQGNVYVTNAGTLHNVSVFKPNGVYQRSIGKEGGRARVGRFEPEGMLAPGGCAIDAQGRLWVAETLDYPKRISVWDTQSGENIDEFFGASAYFGWAWMDPQRPDEVYSHNVIWKVDLNDRTKQIHSTIWRRGGPNDVPPANPDGHAGHLRVVTADNGHQFGWGAAGRSRGHVLYMRDGDIFRPIAGMIAASAERYPALADKLEKLHARWDEQRVPSHQRPRRFFWQDANVDGAVQPNEVTVPDRRQRGAHFVWIGKDLTVWNENGTKFTSVRFEDGRPIYDFTKSQPTPFTASNPNAGSIFFDDLDDGVFVLNPGAEHSLGKWTRDGDLIWSVGKRLPWKKALGKPVMQPGDLWGMTMPLTLAGDFTGAATYFGGYHLLTRDGVYVAMIMRPHKAGGGLGADITASETVTGQIVKPNGMERYFLLAGDQDGRITEIHGLETVDKLTGGRIRLTPDDVDRVVDAQREFSTRQQSNRVLFVQRGTVSFDSDHGEIHKQIDKRRAWRAQLARDDKNLYLRYEVESPAPLLNHADDPQRIFKGGNLIDIQLATHPHGEADRESPAPGDIRLLISRRKDGSPYAVLFEPKVKGFEGEPIVLRSPTGSESFDRIRVLENVAIDYKKTENGFIAVASVPLDTLGWTPASGQTLRGDIGYIFGNRTGTSVSTRSYWRNNGFSANVIDDVPHESRLEPHQWGVMVVE